MWILSCLNMIRFWRNLSAVVNCVHQCHMERIDLKISWDNCLSSIFERRSLSVPDKYSTYISFSILICRYTEKTLKRNSKVKENDNTIILVGYLKIGKACPPKGRKFQGLSKTFSPNNLYYNKIKIQIHFSINLFT